MFGQDISPAVERRTIAVFIIAVMAVATILGRILGLICADCVGQVMVCARTVYMAIKVNTVAGFTITAAVCAAYCAVVLASRTAG